MIPAGFEPATPRLGILSACNKIKHLEITVFDTQTGYEDPKKDNRGAIFLPLLQIYLYGKIWGHLTGLPTVIYENAKR